MEQVYSGICEIGILYKYENTYFKSYQTLKIYKTTLSQLELSHP